MSPTSTPVARRPRSGASPRSYDRSSSRSARDLGVDSDIRRSSAAPGKTGVRDTPQALRHRGNPVRRIVPKPAPGRLGSRQVVSVRGWRVSSTTDRRFGRVSLVAIAVLILGVVAAMALSGQSTSQTFRLQQLAGVESDLENQIETAQRDLEDLRSSAGLAEQAERDNLVVPEQAGVLGVEENGDTSEWRPAEEGTLPIIDVNGTSGGHRGASSDAEEIRDMGGQVQRRPQPQQTAPQAPDAAPQQPQAQQGQQGTGTVPYQDRTNTHR